MDKKTLEEWIQAKEQLDFYKDAELGYRKKICAELFDSNQKKFIFDDFELKATKKINFTVDEDQLKENWSKLSKEEKAAIKFKPSLIAAEFKKVSSDALLMQFITSAEGTPTLTIKPAKVK